MGWFAHYIIGVASAALLLSTFGLGWAQSPSLLPALLREIVANSGSTALHGMQLDLASLTSVRAFVVTFLAKFPRLDVLIANAGIMIRKRQMTADGIEMDFGVNHAGHFLLTDLLLPLLKKSVPARIVRVSSNMHAGGTIDFDDLASEKSWRGA